MGKYGALRVQKMVARGGGRGGSSIAFSENVTSRLTPEGEFFKFNSKEV